MDANMTKYFTHKISNTRYEYIRILSKLYVFKHAFNMTARGQDVLTRMKILVTLPQSHKDGNWTC